jgi:hypothetical protein
MDEPLKRALLLLGVIILFLLITLPVLYLGVLSPRALAPSGEQVAYAPGGQAKVATALAGGGYHVYNPFNSGVLFMLFIPGVIVAFWLWASLTEKVKSTLAIGLALVGAVLIFLGTYAFVSGVHDLLTFTVYERYTKPTFGQQYGWLIESIIITLLGLGILYLSEWVRKQAGIEKSVIPSTLYPTGGFLILATLFIFIFGFHNTLYATDYTKYRENLTWIIETFVFGAMTYAIFRYSEKMRRMEGETKSIYTFPTAAIGAILITITIGIYMFGSLDYIYRDYGEKHLKWLFEATVFGIIGYLFARKSDTLAQNDGEVSTALPTSLYLSSAILFVASLIQFLWGLHDFLYSDKPNLKWLYEFLTLLIPSLIVFYFAWKTSGKTLLEPMKVKQVKKKK